MLDVQTSDLNHSRVDVIAVGTRLAKNEKEDDRRNVGTQTMNSSLFVLLSNCFQEAKGPALYTGAARFLPLMLDSRITDDESPPSTRVVRCVLPLGLILGSPDCPED